MKIRRYAPLRHKGKEGYLVSTDNLLKPRTSGDTDTIPIKKVIGADQFVNIQFAYGPPAMIVDPVVAALPHSLKDQRELGIPRSYRTLSLWCDLGVIYESVDPDHPEFDEDNNYYGVCRQLHKALPLLDPNIIVTYPLINRGTTDIVNSDFAVIEDISAGLAAPNHLVPNLDYFIGYDSLVILVIAAAYSVELFPPAIITAQWDASGLVQETLKLPIVYNHFARYKVFWYFDTGLLAYLNPLVAAEYTAARLLSNAKFMEYITAMSDYGWEFKGTVDHATVTADTFLPAIKTHWGLS